MRPSPLHRWKSFWLGVLVLLCLGWAWARSMHHLDRIFRVAPAFSVSAGQTTGQISLNWDGSQHFEFRDEVWIHEPAPSGQPLFPKAVNWESYPDQIQLTVAHWFLILIFLVSWSAFIGCRWLRIRRFEASLFVDS